jgi:hypothetical protein
MVFEIQLTDYADHDLYNLIADFLESNLKATFKMKLGGLDQSYWDFEYHQQLFTLHQDQYKGISISSEILPGTKEYESEKKNVEFIVHCVRIQFKLHLQKR